MNNFLQCMLHETMNIDDIPEENKNGQCFKVAIEELMKNPKNYTLVHGVVCGQGPLEDLKFCHAWVIDERTDTVIDKTQPAGKQKIPVGLYYYIGKIEITREYNFKQAGEMILKYETYGPWDPIFDNYY